MKKLEVVLLIIIIIAAGINLLDVPGMTSLLMISSCTLAFAYLSFGIRNIGSLGINLIVTKPMVNTKEASFDSNVPQNQKNNGSIFHPEDWKQKLSIFFVTYCFAIMVLAILFRINYWPGSSILLVMGFLQLAIVLVVFTTKQITQSSTFSRQILLRTVIYFLVGVTLYALPESFVIDIKYKNQPEKLQQIKEAHFKKQPH